ncbi:MAG TPA: DUF998 domain-containing protein [Candidatus Saccharimonadales bacterium]|jgi:hypothetical membrane protein
MKHIQRIAQKYQWLGSALWISSLQFFVVQLIVASAWTTPFYYGMHYISDLGNTTCGPFAGLYVCSPLHWLMNLSFVVFGVTIALGAALLYKTFRPNALSTIGFGLLVLSGIGTVLVGLAPENVNSLVHYIGAVLGLLLGNIALLFIGVGLTQTPRYYRLYTIVTGVVCVAAFTLFANDIHHFTGLGRGTVERIVSYPFTVWLIVSGVYFGFVRNKTKK